jgi:hypothetical protein
VEAGWEGFACSAATSCNFARKATNGPFSQPMGLQENGVLSFEHIGTLLASDTFPCNPSFVPD